MAMEQDKQYLLSEQNPENEDEETRTKLFKIPRSHIRAWLLYATIAAVSFCVGITTTLLFTAPTPPPYCKPTINHDALKTIQ